MITVKICLQLFFFFILQQSAIESKVDKHNIRVGSFESWSGTRHNSRTNCFMLYVENFHSVSKDQNQAIQFADDTNLTGSQKPLKLLQAHPEKTLDKKTLT